MKRLLQEAGTSCHRDLPWCLGGCLRNTASPPTTALRNREDLRVLELHCNKSTYHKTIATASGGPSPPDARLGLHVDYSTDCKGARIYSLCFCTTSEPQLQVQQQTLKSTITYGSIIKSSLQLRSQFHRGSEGRIPLYRAVVSKRISCS